MHIGQAMYSPGSHCMVDLSRLDKKLSSLPKKTIQKIMDAITTDIRNTSNPMDKYDLLATRSYIHNLS